MTPQSLNVIRFSLLGGVLFFAVVVWFLGGSGQAEATGDELAVVMRYLFYGLFVTAFGAMYVMRQRVDRAETFARKGPLILVGYAMAEGVALFGIVCWLITGNIMLFLVGLLVFLVAFLVFPVEPASADA